MKHFAQHLCCAVHVCVQDEVGVRALVLRCCAKCGWLTASSAVRRRRGSTTRQAVICVVRKRLGTQGGKGGAEEDEKESSKDKSATERADDSWKGEKEGRGMSAFDNTSQAATNVSQGGGSNDVMVWLPVRRRSPVVQGESHQGCEGGGRIASNPVQHLCCLAALGQSQRAVL